jgi:hypothetical protein
MRHVNLNLLPTLKALLETRSVSRAAELQHLSQPSISKQLAQLRQEFADELLVREGQRWLLTPRAELLLQSLSHTLEVLDELYAPVHFEPADCQRVFRLASSDYVAQYILPEIGEALAQAAGILSFKTEDKKPTQSDVFYFAGIDDARFKRPVMPGDQLHLHVEIERQMRGVWKFKGEARVDGQLAAEARLMCAKRDL